MTEKKQTFVQYVNEHPYPYGGLSREQLPVFVQTYLEQFTDCDSLQREHLWYYIQLRMDALFVRLWCSCQSDQASLADSTLGEGKDLEAFVRYRLSLEQDTKRFEAIINKLDALFWLQMQANKCGSDSSLSVYLQQQFRNDMLHPKKIEETVVRALKMIPDDPSTLVRKELEMGEEESWWSEDECGRTRERRHTCDGRDGF